MKLTPDHHDDADDDDDDPGLHGPHGEGQSHSQSHCQSLPGPPGPHGPPVSLIPAGIHTPLWRLLKISEAFSVFWRDGLIISNYYVTRTRLGRNPPIESGRLNFSNQCVLGQAQNVRSNENP